MVDTMSMRQDVVQDSILQDLGPVADRMKQIATGKQVPPRPSNTKYWTDYVRRMFDQVENVPYWRTALARYMQANNDLLPERITGGEQVPTTQKSGAQDRTHNEPLLYKNLQTSLAMTVPEEHTYRWEALKEVQIEEHRNVIPNVDPTQRRFRDTINLLIPRIINEADHQDMLEAWMQDALQFNMGILKATWRESYTHDAMTENGPTDSQDNAARLKQLLDDANTGKMVNTDEWVEIMQLRETLGGAQELVQDYGVDITNVPYWGFRVDARVRNIEHIYTAGWMAHDLVIKRRDVEQRFPYKILERNEQTGEVTKWTGVHPDDIREINRTYTLTELGNPLLIPQTNTGQDAKQRTTTAKDRDWKDDLILVREIWSREQGRVVTIIDGVNYPVRTWVPKKQPEQWYPFVIFQPNRVANDISGVSNTEMQRPIVSRMNRKRTDDDKLRRAAMGRGFYDMSALDDADQKTVAGTKPGEMGGLKLGNGQRIQDVVAWIGNPYDPAWTDTSLDERDLQRVSNIASQSQGLTGGANFAKEVETAERGTALSANFVQNRARRVLERLYTIIAELAIYNLDEDQVKQLVGPNALWPQYMTDVEAARVDKQYTEKATIMAVQQLSEQIQADMEQRGDQFDPADWAEPLQEAISQTKPQLIQEDTGQPFIMDRHGLFKKLRCKVTVPISAQADVTQRVNMALSIMDRAIAAGAISDFTPWINFALKTTHLDEELAEGYTADPNLLLMRGLQMAAQNPQAVSAETLQAVIGAANMAQDAAIAQNPELRNQMVAAEATLQAEDEISAERQRMAEQQAKQAGSDAS